MTVNQQTTGEVERSAKEHRGTPAAPTTTVRRQPKAVNGQALKATSMKMKPQAQKKHRGVTNVQRRPTAVKRQAHKALGQKTMSTAPHRHLMAMQSTTNRELKMQIPMNREQMRSPKKLQEVTNAALMNHL
jgi:hypothetical protein